MRNNELSITLLDLSRNPVETGTILNAMYSDSAVERMEKISKSDWKKKTPIGLLKAAHDIDSDMFIIAVDDFDTIHDETLFMLLGIASSARKFVFLENSSGKTRRITKLGFSFLHFPQLLLNLFATLIFATVFVVFSYMLRGVVWLRQESIVRQYYSSKNIDRVAYLRTDIAFNIKAGGSVAHTRGVIRGFKDNRKDVLVLSNENAQWLSFDDIPVTVLGHTRLFSFFRETERMINGVVFAFRAMPELRIYRPEVIYQRQCPFDLSGLVLSLWFKIPLVLESNNSDVRGTYWDKTRFKWICSLVERTLMFGSSVIVTISEPMREILGDLEYPSDRIHVLYNGVDIDSFNTADQQHEAKTLRKLYGIKEDDILVGFVGTFGQWHGIPTLTEAVKETLRINNLLYYVLVGDGELKYESENQIRDAGYAEKVIYTGLLAADEIGSYLAACDILISPHSKSPDGRKFFGSPTKLFEYMAASKAIVASDLDQIGEILVDNETALLVEPNNSSELASAICSLAGDKDTRMYLAKSARTEVKKRYTWKRNVEQVVALLRQP